MVSLVIPRRAFAASSLCIACLFGAEAKVRGYEEFFGVQIILSRLSLAVAYNKQSERCALARPLKAEGPNELERFISTGMQETCRAFDRRCPVPFAILPCQGRSRAPHPLQTLLQGEAGARPLTHYPRRSSRQPSHQAHVERHYAVVLYFSTFYQAQPTPRSR